jgi:hypothetical protein
MKMASCGAGWSPRPGAGRDTDDALQGPVGGQLQTSPRLPARCQQAAAKQAGTAQQMRRCGLAMVAAGALAGLSCSVMA